jgi:acyl-coenzyme A thioesterase PaaI-like protein
VAIQLDGLLRRCAPSATATIVQRGLRIGFLDCVIHNARGKLVATATSTCMTLSDI